MRVDGAGVTRLKRCGLFQTAHQVRRFIERLRNKISATLKDGTTLTPKAQTSKESGNYVYNPVGGHTLYSRDGPGIYRGRVPPDILANAVTMRYIGSYTTQLTNGRQTRDFRWSVTVNVNMVTGRVTGQFRRYHVRL